ncbi:MAG TPA: hypothetical protein VMT20_10555, partial [Terriglobia bacterium]|nr:hypothetical protein [Terriglobia bacterium]
ATQLPAATSSAQGAVQLARDLTGSATAPKVAGLQGNPVSAAAPTSNQILTWNGTAWTPTTPAATAGTGACTTNQFVTGVVLGSSPTCTQPAFSSLSGAATAAQLPAASSSAQGAVQLAQDLTGNASAPKVAGLQGNPVSSATPTSNQILTWNGTSWAPAAPPTTGAQIAQDLGGSTASPKVVGLQGNPVSTAAPTSNQVLTWNGTTWSPTTPAATAGTGACTTNQFVTGVVLGSSPTCTQPAFSSLSGAATAAQLPAASASAQGAVQLAQDLTGSASAPKVAGLQGNPVSSAIPTSNQVLAWSGINWAPATPTASGAQIAQDLGGTTAAPKVVGLQGNPVSSSTPGNGQCLTYSGAQWAPGACGSGSGTAAGSTSQLQFNNNGSFGGATNFTYNNSTGSVSIAPAPSQDAVALALAPTVSTPTADVFQVYQAGATPSNTCATNSKCAFAIQSNGNLFFAGNNATYGAPSQTTQSYFRLYGSVSGSSNLAPAYLQFWSGNGSSQATLFSSISQNGILCAGPSVPGGDCTAGQQLLLNPMTTTGDLIVGGSVALGTAQPTRLGIGSLGQCLTSNGTNPLWGSCSGSGGGGSVTSVGLSLPSIFNVSGTPVTSSGTLTGTLATQSANLVWAGPASGVAAAPTFRSLVKADQYSTTAYTDQANTWTAGAQDMSAAASHRVPVAAGLTATVNGQIGYDSTANVPHMAVNSADAKLATFTGTPTTGDCVQWISATQIGDQGSSCGTGGGGSSALSSLTAATTSATLANGNFPLTWNWAQTTASQSGITFAETSAATGSGDNEVRISTQSNSTATPLSVAQGAITNTTSIPALNLTSTWNNASLVGQGIQLAVSNTSSSSSSTLLNLLGGASGTTSEFSVSATGAVTASSSYAGSTVILTSGITSNQGSGSIKIQSGSDGNANIGGTSVLTARGVDILGGTTANTTGGHVLVRGGNNASTGTSPGAGSVEIGAGQDTGASGEALQGLYAQYFSYIKGATVTQWNVQCFSGSMTTADCGTSPGNWIGIAEVVNTNTVQVIASGQVPVNSSNSATVGDTFCAGSTGGKGTDSGGTSACALGSQIGIVAAVSGTYKLPDGMSFTASATLPLVQIARD